VQLRSPVRHEELKQGQGKKNNLEILAKEMAITLLLE
jgi:hypothetical protein